jgi:UDP-N-acetylglucosamine 2-epimerase
MIKVMTIIGTRPEIIKMSRVINIFDKHTNHVIVHTGQNYDYELNQIFFDDLGIRKPNYFLNSAKNSPVKTVAKILENIEPILIKEKPDAILLYGDTNSCLSAIAAKKNKIPIFHMEAGNRCFDQRVPEEINRKIVDHLSDINLVLSEHARRYLIREGISPETIFKTGSHMQEVISFYASRINHSQILKKLKLKKNKFFLASIHREENVDNKKNLLLLVEAFEIIYQKYKLPIIVSTHPRTQKKLELLKLKKQNPRIIYEKPMGFFDYCKLQQNSLCVISDSGTITEEASIFGLSAITIREVHERPEGMDDGILIMSGLSAENILSALDVTITQKRNKLISEISDYKNSNVSTKILKIVLSYIEYINRVVWHK